MSATEVSMQPEQPSTAIYPFLDDASSVESATEIVHGRLRSVDIDTAVATIDVDTVDRGDLSSGDSIDVNLGIWEAPDEMDAYFFIDNNFGNAVINVIDSERRFHRVMAGLPSYDDLPTPNELRSLHESADAVVVASAFTTSPDTADLDVHDVIKGDLTGQVEVRRGYDTGEPGGPWTFDPTVTRDDPSVSGVFFLQRVDDEWLVQNACDPRLTSERDLREALA